MNIIINYPTKDKGATTENLAFFKALLIKEYIESKNITYNQKQELKKEVLETLRKT